jgi:hypothetical protein
MEVARVRRREGRKEETREVGEEKKRGEEEANRAVFICEN